MIIQTRALENLEVTGAEYPAPPEKVLMARVVFYLQMAVFGGIFFGDNAFKAMKMPTPDIVTTIKDNKMPSFMAVWFVGNIIQNNLISTGAFEIHHGDKLIWSSLEEHRLPNMGDLIKAFEATGVEFMTMQTDQ